MKIILRLLSVCILVSLISCKGNSKFTLSGELYNKKEKNIIVIFDDPIAKIDTIRVIDGKFEYEFTPDTITMLRLLNDSGIAIPVFADKGWEVSFNGSFSNPRITGYGANKDMQNFRNLINGIKDTEELNSTIKKFVLENRQSYAAAYIINDFMIQTPDPDIEEIKTVIAQLDGHVKDCRVIDIIQKNISDKNSTDSQYLNYFSSKDKKGKYVSWAGKNDSYTLINLWASWDEKSIAIRDSLYKKVKLVPKEKLRILNISLDLSKKEWESSCKEENEQWIETCDFKGWKNQIVEQLRISKIPFNILVTNNRKIIGKSIYGDSLINKVNLLIKESKDKKSR